MQDNHWSALWQADDAGHNRDGCARRCCTPVFLRTALIGYGRHTRVSVSLSALSRLVRIYVRIFVREILTNQEGNSALMQT